MASGTVGYTDTRGNKDFTSIIASQIGRRLKEASNMASEERAYAAGVAEAGGTSLEEAGIGRGFFFKKALGSRFGGDKIARTRGRLSSNPSAGRNPAGNFKSRFRGGFDYKVTNQNITDTVPISNALVTGLRGVQGGLVQISAAISRQDSTMESLANTQADMARAIMFNGYLFQMFMSQQKAKSGRSSLAREERAIERNFGRGGSGGGAGGGRGMINVTPQSRSRNFSKGYQFGDFASAGTSQMSKLGGTAAKTGQKGARTFVRGVTSGVARPILKGVNTVFEGGRKINKFIPNATKIAKQSSKILGVPASATKQLFSKSVLKGAKGAPQTKAFLAFMDTAVNDRFAGITGLFGPESISKIGAPGFDDLSKANAEELFIKSLTDINAEDELAEALLKSGYEGTYAGVDSAAKGTGRSITKKLSPKAAEAITAQRIASLDNVGLKTAEIASDQIVRKGMQQGLKRGSGLARTMVKTFGAAGTRSILKQIPVVAGVAGVLFGIQRALEGDFLGAGLEITSGLLGATGTTPGIGLTIDGYLLARDLGVVPMAKGGLVYKNKRGKGQVIPMANGAFKARVAEAGADELVAPLDERVTNMFGAGFVRQLIKSKTDLFKILGQGTFLGIGDAASGGIFDNAFDIGGQITEAFGNIKDWFQGILEGLMEKISKLNPSEWFKNVVPGLGDIKNTFKPVKEFFNNMNPFKKKEDDVTNGVKDGTKIAGLLDFLQNKSKEKIDELRYDTGDTENPHKPGTPLYNQFERFKHINELDPSFLISSIKNFTGFGGGDKSANNLLKLSRETSKNGMGTTVINNNTNVMGGNKGGNDEGGDVPIIAEGIAPSFGSFVPMYIEATIA